MTRKLMRSDILLTDGWYLKSVETLAESTCSHLARICLLFASGLPLTHILDSDSVLAN